MATKTLDTARVEAQPSSRPMVAAPHIILAGYGVSDSLQLTVETQRVLARYGSVYTLGAGPNLLAFLNAQRVKVTDLTDRIAPGKPFADAYLETAQFLFERAAHERPVIVLAPGHPLMFNAITRYIAAEGKRLELMVQSLPGISPLDAIIGGIGLDVSTFGLQIFDCTRLVERKMAINPAIPAILMNAGVAGAATFDPDGVPDLRPLVAYLAACYPNVHPVSVVNIGDAGMAVAATSLSNLPAVAGQIKAGSHLFLDLVRQHPTG